MSVDVISAVYGGYDVVKPIVPQTVPVDRWVMVTDSQETAYQAAAVGWTPVVERRPHLHSNVAAKVPKFRPDLYTDADFHVWVDGSATVQPNMVAVAMDTLSTRCWSMYPHPNRNDIGQEVAASRALSKYDDLPMEEQAAYYYKHGYVPHAGLWATGIIGRWRDWTVMNRTFGNCWLHEVTRWGFQDQLSFAFLKVTMGGFDIHPIGSDLWSSTIVHFGGHER